MGRKPLTEKYPGELNCQTFSGGREGWKGNDEERGSSESNLVCNERRQHGENGFCTWCESECRGWAGNWEVKEGNNVHSHQTMLQNTS